jgi:DNA polymerase-3 subunit alpha
MIPSKSRGQKYKLPTLSKIHTHLFDEPCDDAHNALSDVRACTRCYFEQKNRDLFNELGAKPEVKENGYKKR